MVVFSSGLQTLVHEVCMVDDVISEISDIEILWTKSLGDSYNPSADLFNNHKRAVASDKRKT